MKKPFTWESYNYALYGILFGLCFPVVATLIEAFRSFGVLAPDKLLAVQFQSPLLWIIDTAPFVLGLLAFYTGKQLDIVYEMNKKILQAQGQLILHERMASIGQVSAGIAHEIKNPLNFVTNYAESSLELIQELQDILQDHRNRFQQEQFEYVSEIVADLNQNSADIKSNGERASRIVYNLMDQTRDTKGRRMPIGLHMLLDENVKLAYHSFRAGHPAFNMDIQRDYQDLPNLIQGNPHNLGRVLINLFNNACDALNQKQKISSSDYTPLLSIKTTNCSEWVEIRIRDNGIGIPEPIREKIFEPFFTTKPTGQGNTGLGLSISREIIQQEHQGSLEVVSEPGEYTEFLIRLPIYVNVPPHKTEKIQ